jgi:tetratricopeptide (TPR) repeat protein
LTETLLPGNSASSIADALHAARRDLRNVPAVVSITDRLFAAGDIDRAIAVLQETSRIVPDDFLVARTLSGYLATQKRLDEALTCAQKAVAIRPQVAEARLHIASI